jgi:hypothetical protein
MLLKTLWTAFGGKVIKKLLKIYALTKKPLSL